MSQVCPKCQYRRTAMDTHVHPGICPQCGIVYAKSQEKQDNSVMAQQRESASSHISMEESISLRQKLHETLLYCPESVESVVFWGRTVTGIVFALWGLSFIAGGIDWETIGGSFMHNINLPFHEFGHVLFMPFGRFMMILGGSLFQVLLPLILLAAFVWQRRDTFAGSMMLWWCGQSFIDVSPYIADAPYRSLPLIGGMGESAHDWGNLLTMTNAIDSAAGLAKTSFGIGSLLILLAIFWGIRVLMIQRQRIGPF